MTNSVSVSNVSYYGILIVSIQHICNEISLLVLTDILELANDNMVWSCCHVNRQ